MAIAGIKSTGPAWGDIFSVTTPYTDMVGKQIYADAQARALNQQKQSELMDEQFAKEAANIRDVDVNDFADLYNDYKQSKIATMKMNPNINSKEYIQAQLESNRKLAALSQFANTSIANKAALKNINTEVSKDALSGKGMFRHDSGDIMSKANTLPSSQWSTLGYDPTNIESYKNPANPDKYAKIIKATVGNNTKKANYSEDLPASEGLGKLNKTVTGYTGSPAQLSDALTRASINNPGEFNQTYDAQFPDNVAADVTKRYNEQFANNPDAIRLYGTDGVKLPMNGVLTHQQALANLVTMKYYLDNMPTVTSEKQYYNKVGIMNKQEANAEKMQQERFQQQRDMAATKEHISESIADYNRAKTATDQNNSVQKYIDNAYSSPLTTGVGKVNGVDLGGTHYTGRVIGVPVNVLKDFATYDSDGKGKIPNGLMVTDDKKIVIPLFAKGQPDNTGAYKISGESKPQDIQVLKSSLAKELETKAKTGAAVTDDDVIPPSDQSEPSYNIKGKKYTHSELNKMGYSDDQIKQAIKIGTIK